MGATGVGEFDFDAGAESGGATGWSAGLWRCPLSMITRYMVGSLLSRSRDTRSPGLMCLVFRSVLTDSFPLAVLVIVEVFQSGFSPSRARTLVSVSPDLTSRWSGLFVQACGDSGMLDGIFGSLFGDLSGDVPGSLSSNVSFGVGVTGGLGVTSDANCVAVSGFGWVSAYVLSFLWRGLFEATAYSPPDFISIPVPLGPPLTRISSPGLAYAISSVVGLLSASLTAPAWFV